METFAPRGNIYGPILPQFVLEKPVTFGAKIMYALLCNYASEKDHCWPSQATLAARLSCSVSSVKNYLAELVKVKLIEVRRGQYRSSVYYMLNPGELRGQETKVDGQQPEVVCPEPKSGYLNNLSKQSKEENPPLPPTEPETPKTSNASPVSESPAAGGVSVSFPDFEKAWELYPKKDAKGFARIAWLKLQRGGLLPPLDEMRDAIQRFMTSESWQRDNGRFVPQMGNWLRGQRWLDPLSPAEEAAERERQHQEELSRSLRMQEEREKRLQEQRNAEKARLRPLFDALAAKFPEPFNDAMGFGTWMYLHSKGFAPMASDVPASNALGIVDFMNAFKRKREEAQYLASHAQAEAKRLDVRADEPRLCGEILRHSSVFSQFFSGTEQLRQAV